jgi:hypothetical protein
LAVFGSQGAPFWVVAFRKAASMIPNTGNYYVSLRRIETNEMTFADYVSRVFVMVVAINKVPDIVEESRYLQQNACLVIASVNIFGEIKESKG